MKIKELLKNGINELNKNGIEDASLKVKILLGNKMSVTNEYLAVHLEDELDEKIVEKFQNSLYELIAGKPIQYITNSQEFYGLDFYVDENVLIPQPDTEILVEEVISLCRESDEKKDILDICTGSGAIAVALCKNISANFVASDISAEALKIAKKNAVKNDANIKFVKSDMFENIQGKFDIIVSNPPYIETETIKKLSQEVKKEPHLALDGGEDGLKFYGILARTAKEYLKKDGILAVEIGYNQKESVTKLFEKYGLKDVYSKKDFGNNDRIVVGRWR